MPNVSLPENPSMEHLRSQAKLLQQLVRSGDDGALAMVVEFHPSHGDAATEQDPSSPVERLAAFKRADAQLVIARLYGFSGWNALRDHVVESDSFARPDTADTEHDDLVDQFVALGCVSYGVHDPSERIADADAMFADNPDLALSSASAMAVAGNHRALADHIDTNDSAAGDHVGGRSIVDEPCGPNRWPLILYAAYSRLSIDDPEYSGLETVRMLLEAGADANAGFLWRALVPPFTALTGAFGWGECDQAPHRDRLTLARLLLEAGADPNDGQALYNNGLAGTARDDHSHLELLVEFGLGTDKAGPWYDRFGARLTAPADLLYDELEVAAHRGLANRMRFLVGLGLELERGVGRSGQTPMALATAKGHAEVVAVLAAAGAVN